MDSNSGNLEVTDRGALDQSRRLLDRLSGFDGFRHSPLALLQAANFLHGFGFSESLRLISDYCRLGHDPSVNRQDNGLLVARTLYQPILLDEPPPRLALGIPDLDTPQDVQNWLNFPLYFLDELPLIVVGGFLAGGERLPTSTYLDWCAKNTQLRAAQLHPGNNPLAAVDEFLESAVWQYLRPQPMHFGMLRLQILRAAPAYFSIDEDQQHDLLTSAEAPSFWLELRRMENRLHLTWNAAVDAYETRQSL